MTCLGIGCEHHVLPIPECGVLREAAEEAKESMGVADATKPQQDLGGHVSESVGHGAKAAAGAEDALVAGDAFKLELERESVTETAAGSSRDRVEPKRKPRPPQNKKRCGKGEFFCQGCGTSKKAELFPSAQVVCLECKRFLDRIYGQCQRQGELGLVVQTAP